MIITSCWISILYCDIEHKFFFIGGYHGYRILVSFWCLVVAASMAVILSYNRTYERRSACSCITSPLPQGQLIPYIVTSHSYAPP